ncbi:helix-turn-helix transcriptional regulator [Niabella sp. CC-SYL272]|uniref:helix-turn-helix domain-containing protein n=1 Tax=Niabella agricola TaxID=2891571 RepID=UPI001F3EB776|nr:helix-turn-helix transcriptional regulator [Niabella agricola]MCF3110989.1 helix-turn-helix transcriptional regulator [Niabella agricola]
MSLFKTFFPLPFVIMSQYRNDELLTGIAIVAKQLREKLGLSQEEVVNDIKIKTDISIHIGRIETAVGNISISNLSLLCEYYNIPLSKFMAKVEESVKKTKR